METFGAIRHHNDELVHVDDRSIGALPASLVTSLTGSGA
jgi:hypothetical protein